MKFYLVTVTWKEGNPEDLDDMRYIVKADSMVGAIKEASIFYDENPNVEGFSCYALDSFFDTKQNWISI